MIDSDFLKLDDELTKFVNNKYVEIQDSNKNPEDYYVYFLGEEITLPNDHTAGPGFYMTTMEEIPKTEEDDRGMVYFPDAIEPISNLQELLYYA